MNTSLNISEDLVLELAATKIAREVIDSGDIEDFAQSIIRDEIKSLFAKNLVPAVDSVLKDEIEKVMSSEVTPINIWGEPVAEATTIRAAIHERARVYFNEKVNASGDRWDGYGAITRGEMMFTKYAANAFSEAIKQNMVNVIGAFKDAFKDDVAARTSKYVDDLIKVRTQKDQVN